MYREKLADMLGSSSGQEMYLQWLSDPVTQVYIGAIRERGRPARPDIIQTEAAFLSLGESLGWNGAADLMENPVGQVSQAGTRHEPSYGATRILAMEA